VGFKNKLKAYMNLSPKYITAKVQANYLNNRKNKNMQIEVQTNGKMNLN